MNWHKARVVVLLLLVVVGVALAGCGGPKTAQIQVTMTEFAFSPTTWTVPAGAEVTLDMTNSGGLEHEWVVMELGYTAEPPFDDVDEAHVLWEGEVGPGEVTSFTFTAPSEPGEYQVICGISGHFENNMVGTLTVTR